MGLCSEWNCALDSLCVGVLFAINVIVSLSVSVCMCVCVQNGVGMVNLDLCLPAQDLTSVLGQSGSVIRSGSLSVILALGSLRSVIWFLSLAFCCSESVICSVSLGIGRLLCVS